LAEISETLAKNFVENAKNHRKRPHRPRTSSGRKGRKKTKKDTGGKLQQNLNPEQAAIPLFFLSLVGIGRYCHCVGDFVWV
jgi:hypothetical protein